VRDGGGEVASMSSTRTLDVPKVVFWSASAVRGVAVAGVGAGRGSCQQLRAMPAVMLAIWVPQPLAARDAGTVMRAIGNPLG
jgi:hypothetical protein